MSRKDYIAFAKILWGISDKNLRLELAKQMAIHMAANRRFQRQKFIDFAMMGESA